MLAGANDQLKRIYTTGWPGWTTHARSVAPHDFLSASPAQQTALLDLIAYRRNQTPELAPGIQFFTWRAG